MEKKKKQTNVLANEELFEKLEPFFYGTFVLRKKLTLSDRVTYQQVFTDFLTNSGSNFYENFIEKFRERIKEGFQSSMTKIKDIPFDENFPRIIKEDMDYWEYAKSAILVLFKPLDFAMPNGSSLTVQMIVKDKWDTYYLQILNETFDLANSLTRVFSESRKSGNKMSVLPIKNILLLFKREILSTRGQVPLIKMFEDVFCKSSSEDYKLFVDEFFKEGVHGFLPKAKQFMEEEEIRIDNAMDDETGEKMKNFLKVEFSRISLEIVFSKYDEILEQDKEIEFQAIAEFFSPITDLNRFSEKAKSAIMKFCQEKTDNPL